MSSLRPLDSGPYTTREQHIAIIGVCVGVNSFDRPVGIEYPSEKGGPVVIHDTRDDRVIEISADGIAEVRPQYSRSASI